MNQKNTVIFQSCGKSKLWKMQICRCDAERRQEALAFHETFHNGDTHSRFFL